MNKNFPILIAEDFMLRQIIATDIKDIYNGLSNPDVIKYYGVSYKSLTDTQQQMDWFKELEQTATGIWWAIVNNNTFYGAVGFNNLSQIHKKAEIGFWLLPKYWGRGLMSKAVSLVCNYAYNDLQLHRIEALVETDNQNSKKLLEQLNFNFEGTLVDYEIKNGNFISVDIYAKFR